MTCRKEIVTVDIDMTAAQVKEVLAHELHDSYPVLDGDHEDVKGVVSLKDLILTLDEPDCMLPHFAALSYRVRRVRNDAGCIDPE